MSDLACSVSGLNPVYPADHRGLPAQSGGATQTVSLGGQPAGSVAPPVSNNILFSYFVRGSEQFLASTGRPTSSAVPGLPAASSDVCPRITSAGPKISSASVDFSGSVAPSTCSIASSDPIFSGARSVGQVALALSTGSGTNVTSVVRPVMAVGRGPSSSAPGPSFAHVVSGSARPAPTGSVPGRGGLPSGRPHGPLIQRPATLIFRVPTQQTLSRKEICLELFKSIPRVAVMAVQLVPGFVRLTFKRVEDKQYYLARGIPFKEHHVTFQEAEPSVTSVILSHLPVEMPDDTIAVTMSTFGRVVNIAYQFDPDFPGLWTGNRIVKIILRGNHLPPRLRFQRYMANVWYRGMPQCCRMCYRVGHIASACPYKGKCFRCGLVGHSSRFCQTPWASSGVGSPPSVFFPNGPPRAPPVNPAAPPALSAAPVVSAAPAEVPSSASKVVDIPESVTVNVPVSVGPASSPAVSISNFFSILGHCSPLPDVDGDAFLDTASGDEVELGRKVRDILQSPPVQNSISAQEVVEELGLSDGSSPRVPPSGRVRDSDPPGVPAPKRQKPPDVTAMEEEVFLLEGSGEEESPAGCMDSSGGSSDVDVGTGVGMVGGESPRDSCMDSSGDSSEEEEL